jgi:hypothetical protein
MRRLKLGHVVAQESFRWRDIPAELVGVTPDLAVLRPLEPLEPAAPIPSAARTTRSATSSGSGADDGRDHRRLGRSRRPLRGAIRGVIQIGAAINPGNSGGPGMRDTRCRGMTRQHGWKASKHVTA